MGERVLTVANSTSTGRTVRVYAFCTRSNGPINYPAGAVTIVAININNETASVTINLNGAQPSAHDDYLLTAPDNVMNSTSILLNGQLLELGPGASLPTFTPNTVDAGTPISLPALTYGLFVFKDAAAPACL